MARTYSEVPEPRYVERAKFADNGGGGGSGAVYLPVTINDNNDKFLNTITAKELYDLLEAHTPVYVYITDHFEEEQYEEFMTFTSPINEYSTGRTKDNSEFWYYFSADIISPAFGTESTVSLEDAGSMHPVSKGD